MSSVTEDSFAWKRIIEITHCFDGDWGVIKLIAIQSSQSGGNVGKWGCFNDILLEGN